MTQIKKKWLGSDQVDGNNILLLNDQALRSKNSTGMAVDLLKMKLNDVIEMLKAPEVLAEGISPSSLATLRQVEEKVAQIIDSSPEALNTLRELAEALGEDPNFAATLATQIGSLNSAILAAQNSISDETLARQAADQAIQDQLDSLSQGSAGLSDEIAARIAGDQALSQRIDAVETEMETVSESMEELELQVQTDLGTLQTNLQNEEAARQAADAQLQGFIATESIDRANADAQLQGSINMLQGETNTLAGQIAQEVMDREAGVYGVHQEVMDLGTQMQNKDSEHDLAISDLQASDMVIHNDIAQEISDRIAGDNALGIQISALEMSQRWRSPVFLVTNDAELISASEGELLSNILPMGDDDLPLIDVAEFQAGMFMVTRNGAASKMARLYLDGANLKVTFLGFNPLVAGDSFVVKYDLPDSPDSREGMAFYHFNGSDVFKLADIDFALAASINLAPDFVGNAAGDYNEILASESVETAIAKLIGQIKKEAETRFIADSALSDAITAEVTARQNADTALADAATTLSQTVVDNKTSTDAAIAALQSGTAAASLIFDRHIFNITNTDIANGYVEINKKVVADSIHAFVGRLAIHEGDDFSVMPFPTVTRIVFSGDISPAGVSPLAAGDLLYVRYCFRASEN